MSFLKPRKDDHPKVHEAYEVMQDGRMDRREFVRVAALVGVSAGAAYAMAGIPSPAWALENSPFPADDPKAKKGGKLRVGMQVQKMEDSATYSWVEMSNQSRHVVEYLSMTGPDNITRPMLAESWTPSKDLKTWTFKLRKGVMWHNGEELVADHVVWNIKRWLTPGLGTSNTGLATFGAMLKDSGKKDAKGKAIMVSIENPVEALDKHTVRFNLSKSVLSVPEDCYHYPAAILHPSFKKPLSENLIGTGPYEMTELEVGKKCVLKRITKMKNGKPFKYWGGTVYLDEIQYFNFSSENQLAALASNSVDAINEFSIEQMALATSLPVDIHAARTARTLCLRMQISQKPFDNHKLRQALVTAADNGKIKNLVYPKGGDVGQNHHVAPVHPEYFPLPTLKRDVAKAKKLLAEAGYKNGIELTIDVGNTDGPWHQTVCEALRDQVKEAGINLKINVMPASKYWEVWDKTPFGATAWTHRALGTMVMGLGYRTGVSWNETHFASKEFDDALSDAEATFDVEERRKKMAKVQKLLQDAAVMVLPLFRPVYNASAKNVHGYLMHPTGFHQFNKVWIA
ncbi:MAG: ABC transporter substrate-binding protein [Rhodospirillaceae bacterium]|nr:ABC transporter substrate-binding protein [Rhodospirillaceae bacterium]MXW93497.1 ABC transporter substrate-binding protein [Rhodospirillaceae bacterium]MYB12007.1 ABC transporter substrate-binding protein [Rhodospirillaceae bacterium]MYI48735.1 ABC transporter substrate-binding protein [Rhodospirillaceae bacterium]